MFQVSSSYYSCDKIRLSLIVFECKTNGAIGRDPLFEVTSLNRLIKVIPFVHLARPKL